MRPFRLLPLIALLLPTAAYAAGEGLDSLNDDALLTELGSRGLTSLLDRAFEVNKIPKDARDGQLALIAINQLNDPAAKLTTAQKHALVDQAVAGIQTALPSLKDPKGLMKAATVLVNESIEKDVNTLEYWGDDPAIQGQLHPVVVAVIKILDQAHTLAAANADKAANLITSQNDKTNIARYEEMNNLALTAEYTKYLLNYDLILSLDKADAQRKTIADDTLKYLKDFDVNDQPVRALVDLRTAKIQMITGQADDAHKTFAVVIGAKPADFSTPPDIQQQYEARYFDAVDDIYAQKPDGAQKGLDNLIAWQAANLPKEDAAVKGANAAAAMLKYRIESQRSDLATDPDEKKKFNDEGVATLQQLLKDQPNLQGIIFQQLMAKLPADAPMNSLDPLLLQAMMHRGEQLALKPDPLTPETTAIMQRATTAAQELISRPGIDAAMSNNARLLVGFLLQKSDRLPEAATAFLDFTAKNVNNPAELAHAQLTLNNAEATLGKLRADSSTVDDPQTVKEYERLLPLAVNPPFNQTDLAYEYARRLLKQNKAQESIKYFKLVPDNDPRILFARYYETIALKAQLDTLKAADPQRAGLLTQLQSLADQVRQGAEAAIPTAPPDRKSAYRSMLAGTSLLAAEVARADQKNPPRALQLLTDFEAHVAGLPDENNRLTDMLLIRVQSYMALNQTDQATAELVKLLNRNPAEGGRLVYGVLTSLDEQLDRAEAANNTDQIRDIARNRAKLTGFLVNMAQTSKDPNINKLAYGYAVFDAEVQRYAAMQEPNADQQKAGLEKALDLFKKLNNPQSLAQYKADLSARDAARKAEKPSAIDGVAPAPVEPEAPPEYDPAVLLGLSRTEFDLGDWAAARDGFARLVNEKKLGPPIRISKRNGQEIETDNDQFWEANYKLLKSNFTLNNPPDVTRSLTYLKTLYIRYGSEIGGKKWHADFEKLRQQVAPDFDPNNLKTPSSTPSK